MIGAPKNPRSQRGEVVKQISRLRNELEDLSDYLDAFEARARNEGGNVIRLLK